MNVNKGLDLHSVYGLVSWDELKVTENSYGRKFIEIRSKPDEKFTTINELIEKLAAYINQGGDDTQNIKIALNKIKTLQNEQDCINKSGFDNFLYRVASGLASLFFNRSKEMRKIENFIESKEFEAKRAEEEKTKNELLVKFLENYKLFDEIIGHHKDISDKIVFGKIKLSKNDNKQQEFRNAVSNSINDYIYINSKVEMTKKTIHFKSLDEVKDNIKFLQSFIDKSEEAMRQSAAGLFDDV